MGLEQPAGYYEIGMSRCGCTQSLGIWINTILNLPSKKIMRDYRSHPDAITFQYFILLLKHTRAGMRPLLNYLGNVGCQLAVRTRRFWIVTSQSILFQEHQNKTSWIVVTMPEDQHDVVCQWQQPAKQEAALLGAKSQLRSVASRNRLKSRNRSIFYANKHIYCYFLILVLLLKQLFLRHKH